MSEQREHPRRIAWFAPWTWKRRWWIAVVVMLTTVGYPLSYGPTVLLMTENWISYPLFRIAYTPLRLLGSHNRQANDALEWYANRFQPRSRHVVLMRGEIVLVE